LAYRFDVQMINMPNKETCVQGIILKSEDHHGLFEFLQPSMLKSKWINWQ
jgi:hypothetical protein